MLPPREGRSRPDYSSVIIRRCGALRRRTSLSVVAAMHTTTASTLMDTSAQQIKKHMSVEEEVQHDVLRWLDNIEAGKELAFLEAQLRLLANAASDRAQMHSILAQQRDNWNKLLQGTLTLASLSACLLAAISAGASAPSLCVPALLLNTGCAAIMSVVNHFQPSQLAEEQRSATRQFRRLVNDVKSALQTPLHLRQDTAALLFDSQQRLRALDIAFPMPLTLGGGLDKFPSKVTPPDILGAIDETKLPVPSTVYAEQARNGWDERKSRHLQQLALQVRRSDTDMYVGWARNVSRVNKCLAIAAPILAASAAALNGVGLVHHNASMNWMGTLAALCSLTSAFVGSVSHDLQLGTVFEMYRNAAGHYAEVDQSIHKALRAQPSEQEHGLLFLHRVAYKLGRWDDVVDDAVTKSE